MSKSDFSEQVSRSAANNSELADKADFRASIQKWYSAIER
jgi:hypothetical protein